MLRWRWRRGRGRWWSWRRWGRMGLQAGTSIWGRLCPGSGSEREGAGLYVGSDEVDDGFERCTGAEDLGYALLFEVGDVLLGDGAAEDEEYILFLGFAEERGDAGDDGV